MQLFEPLLPLFPAYREEETFGPDPSMMRENCLVQTTEWSACSKTCGLGISTRVTNDNRECRLEKQTRLCMVRPCESHLEQSIRVSLQPPEPPRTNPLHTTQGCSMMDNMIITIILINIENHDYLTRLFLNFGNVLLFILLKNTF